MTNVYSDGPRHHEGRVVLYLGLRIDFKVPLAVGKLNDLDGLEYLSAWIPVPNLKR